MGMRAKWWARIHLSPADVEIEPRTPIFQQALHNGPVFCLIAGVNKVPLPLLIAGLFFGGIIIWSVLAVVLRGIRSRASWSRGTARVKTFRFTYGVPNVTFEYSVDGRTFEGNKIVPGVSARSLSGTGSMLPKSVYLNPGGSLKFLPNTDVDVFYDRKNPGDSALVPGIQPGFGKILPVVLGLVFALTRFDWIQHHVIQLCAALFFCAGLAAFCWGWKCRSRHLRSRDFPSVPGRLLKAEIAYSSGGGDSGGGWVPTVEFEYEVDGTIYQSGQMTALPAQVLKSKKADVQLMLDKLRAEAQPRVFYDPKAPWNGFLQHGPAWGVFAPMLMGLAFMGTGIGIGVHLGQ